MRQHHRPHVQQRRPQLGDGRVQQLSEVPRCEQRLFPPLTVKGTAECRCAAALEDAHAKHLVDRPRAEVTRDRPRSHEITRDHTRSHEVTPRSGTAGMWRLATVATRTPSPAVAARAPPSYLQVGPVRAGRRWRRERLRRPLRHVQPALPLLAPRAPVLRRLARHRTPPVDAPYLGDISAISRLYLPPRLPPAPNAGRRRPRHPRAMPRPPMAD